MADPRWERLPCGRDKQRLLEIVVDRNRLNPVPTKPPVPTVRPPWLISIRSGLRFADGRRDPRMCQRISYGP